jgi:cyclophilin family peptidyl-prolyl cis-trans isomerase
LKNQVIQRRIMKVINTLRGLILAFAAIMIIGCQSGGPTYVMIETDYGNMKVELYDSTPLHKENFIKLTKEAFYDDLLFHRVIKGFMVQGGDPNSKGAQKGTSLGSGGPGYKIDAEIGAPHFKGTLAAARQGGPGNPAKQSSGSQFYLVQGKTYTPDQLKGMALSKKITYNDDQIKKYGTLGGTPQLDMDYTVFGEVVEGLDVIDKIAAVQTAPGDRPVEDVKMKVRILK